MAKGILIHNGSVIEGNATPNDVLSGKTFMSENSDDLQTGILNIINSLTITSLFEKTYSSTNGYGIPENQVTCSEQGIIIVFEVVNTADRIVNIVGTPSISGVGTEVLKIKSSGGLIYMYKVSKGATVTVGAHNASGEYANVTQYIYLLH